MIAALDYGGGFYGILAYAIHKEGARLIGAAQGTLEELAQDFGVFRSLKPQCRKPVLHLSLSLHPEERLSDGQWESAAETMMTRLGYRDHFYAVVHHSDTDHSHIHIVASRISPEGSVPQVSFEKRKASAIACYLEKKFGLRRASLAWGEKPKERRWSRLRRLINRAALESNTVSEWTERLARLGVGVQANLGGDHVSGVSFWFEGRLIKGSALGRRFSWKALADRLDYRPERDLPRLRQARKAVGRAKLAAQGRPAPGRGKQAAKRRGLMGTLGGAAMKTGRALSRETRKAVSEEEEREKDRGLS